MPSSPEPNNSIFFIGYYTFLLVVKIPADGLLDTLLKLQRGFPTEFLLELGRIDGVAQVVSGTVGNEGDKVHVLTFLASQQTVNGLNNHLDDVDVLPLVEAADVIRIGYFTLMENEVNSTGMILYIQPVAHILTLAVDGQRLAMTDVVDEQRNQFLRELIRSVVVRAVGHDDGHAVSVVISTYKVVTGSLCS